MYRWLCFLLLFCCEVSVLNGMHVPMLDRYNGMPTWEGTRLVQLVRYYDRVAYDPAAANPMLSWQVRNFHRTRRLVRHFVDRCCVNSFVEINPGLHAHLWAMASNAVGRELIYRTMANGKNSSSGRMC
jgi:hypothetical protein